LGFRVHLDGVGCRFLERRRHSWDLVLDQAAADLFSRNAPGVAWKTKPSWYIVATQDRTVQPDLERFFAKRMNATTYEIESSHVAMLSHPEFVAEVIRDAVAAVQRNAVGSGVA